MSTRFTPTLVLIFFLVFSSPGISAEPIHRFLWVECEGTNRTLDSIVHVDAMLKDAKDWGVDTLFIQVYRGDKAWFQSTIADASPWAAFRKKEGKDMLQYLLDSAHREGMQVHAWVNTFRAGKDPKAGVIRKLGKRAITRDNKGRSMLDYPQLQLPGSDNNYYEADGTGYWLDPGDPTVQDYLLSVLRELMQRYPSLDGLQLDFIRLPFVVPFSPGARFPKGITYGYGERSVERFRAAKKWDPLRWDGSTASAAAWDDWRRDQITVFVVKIQKEIRGRLPRAKLSAAVICYGDRAYLSAFQDWRGWLERGFVDFAAIMNYSVEAKLCSQVTRADLAFARFRPVWVGLGPYLLRERPKIFQQQLEDAIVQLNGIGKGGIGFFSYDSLKLTPHLVDMLRRQGKELAHG